MNESDQVSAADVAIGGSALLASSAAVAARAAGSILRPVVRFGLRPPGLPPALQPAGLLAAVARVGVDRRSAITEALTVQLDELVPVVLEEMLRRARLTELVLRYVDLDAVIAGADLDAAARRLDVDAVVRRADLDAAIARADIDAVASRLDLDAVIDRIDLTDLVLRRVDLDVLIVAVLARIDLVGLAEEVIDAVDLPEIIRESTGSMASETVRGARMQSIVADEVVGRAVDRLLLRTGRKSNLAQADEAP
ncbi:MAG: hypothetical protein ACXWXY_11330, partial [Aeromicrobium sp.]